MDHCDWLAGRAAMTERQTAKPIPSRFGTQTVVVFDALRTLTVVRRYNNNIIVIS